MILSPRSLAWAEHWSSLTGSCPTSIELPWMKRPRQAPEPPGFGGAILPLGWAFVLGFGVSPRTKDEQEDGDALSFLFALVLALEGAH